MKTILKVLKWLGLSLLVLIAGLYLFVVFSWDKKQEAPYPEIIASKDSAIIARGKYLAYGPSHCATCHVPMDKIKEVENGTEIPLIGGWEMSIGSFGVFRASNLTPDPETGIGKLSDQELARTLRHGVGSDGRVIFPFMPYTEMTDEDLTAVISFLRSQKPVQHEIKRSEYGFLAKALIAFGLFGPEGPKTTPMKSINRDSSAAYGKYVAYNLTNCRGCHTELDPATGKYIGKDFAGGMLFVPDQLTEGYAFVTPNLTPDVQTGIMANWDQSTFLDRFRLGRIHKGSPMPWGAFSRMDEIDIKALYSYMRSLDPVSRKVEKIVFSPGEQIPGK
jgi:mono/diheme cytochrome c family protein